VVSKAARLTLLDETGIAWHDGAASLARWAAVEGDVRFWGPADLAAGPSSGSYPTRGMVVVPASTAAVAGIALGLSKDLLQRAADVTLKERRPLVVVPRETPLGRSTLQQLLALHDAGAVVLDRRGLAVHRHAGAHDLAARRGLRISNHAATGAREHYEGRDVEHLHRLGVLDEHWLLVHAIWLSDRDVELVDDTGAWVIDTPTSQAARGGGVTRARDLRRFALGTDGPMVDASVDMLEQAKALLAEQNQAALAPTRIDARAALAAATIDAARAIGLGAEIGSLEPGKRADIAVFDLSAPHVGIAHDPVVSLVTAARGPDVKHVLVDGRPSNGLVLDYGELRDEAAARARELASLAGLR